MAYFPLPPYDAELEEDLASYLEDGIPLQNRDEEPVDLLNYYQNIMNPVLVMDSDNWHWKK